ncbi:MAG: tryptophan synthase subunit alpha [Myxococcales bacterium]|nr:tryptophan synthase subunit alpha [Myxococcales bacterium]MCB9733458.1 tryptophan synthase subunit alpha [Deltaproteobacteria bacterium]
MSDRLTSTFSALRDAGRTAFIPYVTAGDPDLETTGAILDALAEAGADVIELGMPFSDPMADGPVIEAAMVRALANGTTLDGVLSMLAGFRARHPSVPVVLFGYMNPLLRRGVEAACQALADAGGDALLVVDLPPEEAAELTRPAKARGLDFIGLFTPTSDDARVSRIAEEASGFAYYVSMGGVTGDALKDLDPVAARVTEVRALTGLPVCVGFGVRTPDDAVRIARFADGVVVGTALVDLIAKAAPGEAAAAAGRFVRGFREALDAL